LAETPIEEPVKMTQDNDGTDRVRLGGRDKILVTVFGGLIVMGVGAALLAWSDARTLRAQFDQFRDVSFPQAISDLRSDVGDRYTGADARADKQILEMRNQGQDQRLTRLENVTNQMTESVNELVRALPKEFDQAPSRTQERLSEVVRLLVQLEQRMGALEARVNP
jgi:hypothetical protein